MNTAVIQQCLIKLFDFLKLHVDHGSLNEFTFLKILEITRIAAIFSF